MILFAVGFIFTLLRTNRLVSDLGLLPQLFLCNAKCSSSDTPLELEAAYKILIFHVDIRLLAELLAVCKDSMLICYDKLSEIMCTANSWSQRDGMVNNSCNIRLAPSWACTAP